MNKAITIGLIGLLLFFGLQGQQGKVDEHILPLEVAGKHLSFTGTITEVRGEEDQKAILVQDQKNEDNAIVFYLENVLLLDDTTKEIYTDKFSVGQQITAFYGENTPMALSMPPLMTPQVIVVNSSEEVGFVHVANFDETLTSSDGQLKLKPSTDTVIVDIKGNPVTNLVNKTLVVFYTTSTRSIPAQTTPQKIIVLN